jgi:hypothetical protein
MYVCVVQALRERVKILIPLLAAVYLGFYLFGAVLSVFNPVDQWGFTLIAAICALGLGAVFVAHRRGIDPVPADSPLARSARAEREKRGF